MVVWLFISSSTAEKQSRAERTGVRRQSTNENNKTERTTEERNKKWGARGHFWRQSDRSVDGVNVSVTTKNSPG